MKVIGAGIVGSAVSALMAQPRSSTAFPKGAIIRTLLADVPPDALAGGATLLHEHLSLMSTPPPEQVLPQVVAAAKEGVWCIVDAGHADMKRDLAVLRDISRRTGVHVVGSAGYHSQRFYPSELMSQSERQIADALATEAEANHLGAFGEIGESNDAPMTDAERKVLRAVGMAHLWTKLPIFTHTAYGTGANVPRDAGLRQLDLLESVGADPAHVMIGHVCCHDEPSTDTIKAIAKRGAFVGFDRVTGGYVPDDQKVRAILRLLEAGFRGQVILSSDFTGRQTPIQRDYGITLSVFVPKLRDAGVDDKTLREITIDNPRRLLAFVPSR